MTDEDRTDRIGDRDLTAWPTRAGQAVVRTTMRGVDRSRGWLDDRSVPVAVLLVTATIGVLVSAAFVVLSAEIYDHVAEREGVSGFDRPVLDWVAVRRTDTLDALVSHYTDLGGTVLMPVIATASAIVLAVWWRRWTPILLMAVAAGGSLTLTIVGKQAIGRARPPHELAVPPHETSPSFPSGHTLNSWVIFLLTAYLVCCKVEDRRWRVGAVVVAVALAVAMGLSRVYLGHHWLTDVLVGWTIGSAWLIIVVTAHRLALTVTRRKAAAAEPVEPTGPAG
jgi:undecaprenyl-diphosphatase